MSKLLYLLIFAAVKETDYEKQLKEEEKILESIAERKGANFSVHDYQHL